MKYLHRPLRLSLEPVAAALAALFTMVVALPAEGEETVDQRFVISIDKIWDGADHCAFTDLATLDGYLYCAFREGSGHIPGLNGTVRILRSSDRLNWTSVAMLDEQHVDLRDPKLSITPDGRLMVNMGASYYHGSQRRGIESRVSFSDGKTARFSRPQKVVFPEAMITGADWLWRVTWHDGAAWGCVQQLSPDGRSLRLVRSGDGIEYAEVTRLDVDSPSETTLRFLGDGTLVAMIRCEGQPPWGRIATARPPYKDWKITPTNKRFGGPNFVQLPGGSWLAGSRSYDTKPQRTQLWWLDLEAAKFRDLLTFPSAGDNSYPGIEIDQQDHRLYVSYYSSHEGKAAIYLATLRLDALVKAGRGQ